MRCEGEVRVMLGAVESRSSEVAFGVGAVKYSKVEVMYSLVACR